MTRTQPHDGVRELWNDYAKLKRFKAMVMSGEPDGAFVVGMAGGQPSIREARRAAYDKCREKRLERRFQRPCRYYAVGSEIVW